MPTVLAVLAIDKREICLSKDLSVFHRRGVLDRQRQIQPSGKKAQRNRGRPVIRNSFTCEFVSCHLGGQVPFHLSCQTVLGTLITGNVVVSTRVTPRLPFPVSLDGSTAGKSPEQLGPPCYFISPTPTILLATILLANLEGPNPCGANSRVDLRSIADRRARSSS